MFFSDFVLNRPIISFVFVVLEIVFLVSAGILLTFVIFWQNLKRKKDIDLDINK